MAPARFVFSCLAPPYARHGGQRRVRPLLLLLCYRQALAVEAGDAWGLSSSSSAAARRLQSRYDLYMGFDEVDAGGEEVEAHGVEAYKYNCPFCGEDFDFVGLCCHINYEHAVEAKSGICYLFGGLGLPSTKLSCCSLNWLKGSEDRRAT